MEIINNKSIIKQFSPSLFWDVEQLSLDNHGEFIIARVLNEGLAEDIRKLWTLFPENDIKRVVKNRRNLNARTAHFWCRYFNIPLEQCNSLKK